MHSFTNTPADCSALTVRTEVLSSVQGSEVCKSDAFPWPLLGSRWAAASRDNWTTSVNCGFIPKYESIVIGAGTQKDRA